MSIFEIFSLFGCSGVSKAKIEAIEHSPFTIKKKNLYGKRYDINTASRVNNSRSYYSIFYKDQPINFAAILDENSGVPGLWKVYILKDAPQPALVAGSKSVYLITEENENYNLMPLSEQNSGFASIQWLDSEAGQPDLKQELFSSDDTDRDCLLGGGQFLLINKQVVLDVKTLSVQSFNLSAQYTDNYSANSVIGFSPDKDKIVYMGSKYDGKDHYALLTYDINTNQAQVIPFDRTKTRLHEPHDLHSEWLTTYFSWEQKDKKGFELRKVNYDPLPNWEGHFTREGAYSISPATIDMLQTLAEFTQEYLELPETAVRIETFNGKEEYNLEASRSKLKISYLESLQSVYFSDHILDEDEEACKKIIEKVGKAFNVRLRSGEHQSLFTSY